MYFEHSERLYCYHLDGPATWLPICTSPVALGSSEKVPERRRCLDAVLLCRHVVAVSLPIPTLGSDEEEGLLAR